jgi:putative multiple sugar transport system ATP-binding protein
MKVLSGVYPSGSYEGEIHYDGKLAQFRDISDSEQDGIIIIHQELALVPLLSIAENLFLGNERASGGVIDWKGTFKETEKLLNKVGLSEAPTTKVDKLGVGKQQLVEIAKSLSKDVKLLILDGPTAALNENDSDNLLGLLRGLRDKGVTCIMITHKLKEVIAISDSVTVLRDGQTIVTLDAHKGEVTENALIKHMVGREIENIYPSRDHQISDEVVFEVKDWTAYDPSLERTILKDAAFTVKKGEIVGIAGLMGSGRTELALSLFGNPDSYQITGEMLIQGQKHQFKHPREAIDAGLAYVSEDRKGNGLILIQDIKQNVTLANLQEISERYVVNDNAEINVANEY